MPGNHQGEQGREHVHPVFLDDLLKLLTYSCRFVAGVWLETQIHMQI